jgi:hypothetical protein
MVASAAAAYTSDKGAHLRLGALTRQGLQAKASAPLAPASAVRARLAACSPGLGAAGSRRHQSPAPLSTPARPSRAAPAGDATFKSLDTAANYVSAAGKAFGWVNAQCAEQQPSICRCAGRAR